MPRTKNKAATISTQADAITPADASTALAIIPQADFADASTDASTDATDATPADATPAPAITKAALYASARAVFNAFDGAASLPIKPLATFKAYRPAIGVLKPGMRPSPRQAATLCVAALASGQALHGALAIGHAQALLATAIADGSTDADKQALRTFLADTAITFSRRFILGANDYATENGATADCVSSGLASYHADAETFTIHAMQSKTIRGLLGARAAQAFATV